VTYKPSVTALSILGQCLNQLRRYFINNWRRDANLQPAINFVLHTQWGMNLPNIRSYGYKFTSCDYPLLGFIILRLNGNFANISELQDPSFGPKDL